MLEKTRIVQVSARKNYENFLDVYKKSSHSNRTAEFKAGELKLGRTRFEDNPREWRPKTVTTPEIIEQAHHIVSEGRSLTNNTILFEKLINNSKKTGSNTNLSA